MKKIVCLFLVFVMLTLVLSACGKKPASTESSATGGSDTGTATTATTFPGADEIRALPAAARNFRIQLSAYGNAEKVSKNDKFVAGPDSINDDTPLIEQMVYRRNQAANELLGTTVSYVYWSDLQWGSQAGRISELVQGKDPDAPDLFVDMIYDLGNATLNADFKDTWSIPNSCFNFDANGWMTEWMKSMSLTGDRAYILAGDYFLDVLRAMTVLPFNMTMMDANAGKLASVIGQSVEEGEELTPLFFDFVEGGRWTWDVLGQFCEAIWEDLDSSGDDSIGDRLGFLGSGRTNMSSSMYLYSNSEQLFETKKIEDPSDPNNGKTWVYYADVGGLGDIFDAVESVFSGSGTLAPDVENEGNSPDKPGLAYHWIKFGQGETLFAGACVLGAMEDNAFQEMQDSYSVVPLPKVHEEGAYNTVIHNVGDAGAINVNASPMKARALSAYLQYCTEHSGEIREEFLEIVTKYKTTVYNQGTDRMLDIIYDSVINGRDKSIEDIMGTSTNGTVKNNRWHVLLKEGNQFTHDSSFISSKYQSAVSAKQAYLDEKLAIWYTLPKTGD